MIESLPSPCKDCELSAESKTNPDGFNLRKECAECEQRIAYVVYTMRFDGEISSRAGEPARILR